MEEQFNKFTELMDKSIKLAEAMNNAQLESAEVNELYTAFAKASASQVGVEKSGHAMHIKYKYAKIEDMISVWRPILATHGLSIIQKLVTFGGNIDFIYTRLQHSSGQWTESRFRVRWQPDPNIDRAKDLQNQGSAISYAKRYAYGSMVGISYDEDDDLQSFQKPGNR